MEAPGRVELPTNGLGNRCSIHLSYGALFSNLLLLLQFTAVAPDDSKRFHSTFIAPELQTPHGVLRVFIYRHHIVVGGRSKVRLPQQQLRNLDRHNESLEIGQYVERRERIATELRRRA